MRVLTKTINNLNDKIKRLRAIHCLFEVFSNAIFVIGLERLIVLVSSMFVSDKAFVFANHESNITVGDLLTQPATLQLFPAVIGPSC